MTTIVKLELEQIMLLNPNQTFYGMLRHPEGIDSFRVDPDDTEGGIEFFDTSSEAWEGLNSMEDFKKHTIPHYDYLFIIVEE